MCNVLFTYPFDNVYNNNKKRKLNREINSLKKRFTQSQDYYFAIIFTQNSCKMNELSLSRVHLTKTKINEPKKQSLR